jgi:hypothetical protein
MNPLQKTTEETLKGEVSTSVPTHFPAAVASKLTFNLTTSKNKKIRAPTGKCCNNVDISYDWASSGTADVQLTLMILHQKSRSTFWMNGEQSTEFLITPSIQLPKFFLERESVQSI